MGRRKQNSRVKTVSINMETGTVAIPTDRESQVHEKNIHRGGEKNVLHRNNEPFCINSVEKKVRYKSQSCYLNMSTIADFH